MQSPRKTSQIKNKFFMARSYKSRVLRAVPRLMHLDAGREASEERPEAYLNTLRTHHSLATKSSAKKAKQNRAWPGLVAWCISRGGVVLAFAVLALPAIAHAQYNSPNYEIDEIFIGSGGELDACGTAYCADQILGGTAVGDTDSNNFRAEGGFGTPGEPTLSMTVSNSNIDLGVLNTSSTAASSANFNVSNYLSNGYVVRIYGDTPTNNTGPGTHSLTALNSPSASTTGTEQFGINLVANTTPGIGANPSQAPDSTFSFGEASAGYDTPDYYKYVDGDIIAESSQSSGQTDYTISIIANIATSTPGGQYVTTLVVQAIATF